MGADMLIGTSAIDWVHPGDYLPFITAEMCLSPFRGLAGRVICSCLLSLAHNLLPAVILSPPVAFIAHAGRQAIVKGHRAFRDLTHDAVL